MPSLVALVLAAVLIGCGGAPLPPVTAAPTTGAVPSPAALRPLPLDVAALPRPGEPSVVLQPESQRGGFAPGVERPFELGHCGLGSPIDFDGSLWNPIAGDDGAGGPLTADQEGELINQTPGRLTLLTPDVAQFVTPDGARIVLARLPGGRPYRLCD